MKLRLYASHDEEGSVMGRKGFHGYMWFANEKMENLQRRCQLFTKFTSLQTITNVCGLRYSLVNL